MANSSSLILTLTVALLVVTAAIPAAQAQAQTCASKLVPCAAYLNATTTPPNTCCDPIKEAVANDLQCLCNLYSNPAFLSGLGINIQQALRLPRLCGVSSDTSVCKSAQAPNVSTPKPPPVSTQGQSSASKISSSAVIGLLFVLACILLF